MSTCTAELKRQNTEWTLMTASEVPVWVRTATEEDLTIVNELHERCTMQTLASRYFVGRSSLRAAEWRRLVDPARGRTFVLGDPADEEALIGYATVIRAGDEGMAEMSLLLRDDWQGAGVGRVMAQHLLHTCHELRIPALIAWIRPENTRARKLLLALGARSERDEDGDVRWVLPTGSGRD